MSKYRLMYFAIRARAEPARLLFALSGQPYEDHRLSRDEWKTIKNTTPFGQVPILFVDGKPLAQSRAIYRYLGKKFGYGGENDWDAAQIDALADQIEDYRNQIRPFFPIANGVIQGDLNKYYTENVIPATDSFLPIVENKYLNVNKSGLLVGNKVSWVDLFLAEVVETFSQYNKSYTEKYSKVSEHKQRVYSLPGIKEWVEKRPTSIV
ncbi:unnamed protein product, partial [Mesorhabditis belari]|uniref:glutathione transferase n=1 Tax=Mesorhabditis belari TaxID=2138241 RepID=A0AAF3J4N8_9BILA